MSIIPAHQLFGSTIFAYLHGQMNQELLSEHDQKQMLGRRQLRTSLTAFIACDVRGAAISVSRSDEQLPPSSLSPFPFSWTILSTPSGPVGRSQPPILHIRHSQGVQSFR